MACFTDRSIVITGASSGIGRALSLELAAQGAWLALAARDSVRLEALAESCRRLGARAVTVPTDVAQAEHCRRLVERSLAEFGRLDVLINNAGQLVWSRFDELHDLALLENLMRVNLLGSVYTTHAALPHLKQSRGQIVALSSIAGLVGVPYLSGYAATKHALVGFYDSLRVELRGSGVDITIVAPDFTQSEILRRAVGSSGEPLPISPINLERYPTAADCARHTLRAMERRQRLAVWSTRARWSRWGKLLCPGLVDRIAARAVGADAEPLLGFRPGGH